MPRAKKAGPSELGMTVEGKKQNNKNVKRKAGFWELGMAALAEARSLLFLRNAAADDAESEGEQLLDLPLNKEPHGGFADDYVHAHFLKQAAGGVSDLIVDFLTRWLIDLRHLDVVETLVDRVERCRRPVQI
jgi:hypothetical protein